MVQLAIQKILELLEWLKYFKTMNLLILNISQMISCLFTLKYLGWKSKSHPMGCTSHDYLWDFVKIWSHFCTHSWTNHWWIVCCHVFDDHRCWFIKFTICWFEFNKKPICARFLDFLWSCKLCHKNATYKKLKSHIMMYQNFIIFRLFQNGQKKTLIVMAL